MATFRRFEEIVAWQRARDLAREVYATTRRGPLSRDPALRDQLRRAAVSAMSNISEGFERDGNREFIQFLAVAKGSIGEIRSQLYLARDEGFIEQATFERLESLATEAGRTVKGLIKYLGGSSVRGKKFS